MILHFIASLKRFGERGFACLAVVFCLVVAGDARASTYTLRVVVFGDSLTSGYQLSTEQSFPVRLERKLKAVGYDVDVLNASIPTDTTADGLDRVDKIVLMHPDVVVYELGTNDVERGIDINQINVNLHKTLYELKKNGIQVLTCGVLAPAKSGRDYQARIKQLFYGMAALHMTPYYPYILDGVAGVPELNLADGVHPNAEGVNVMVDNMYPYLDSLLRWKLENLDYYQQK